MGFIINPYQVQPSVPAFTGILDTYTGAAAAYSVARRLSSSYTGSLIRVRRSSDNAEQDIGYDSGNILDTSALTSFVGANSAYVTTWYDQSGNAKHITQSTASYQPRIINAGTIDTFLGKPTMYFDTNSKGLETSFSTGTYSAASAFTVVRRPNNLSDNAIIYGYAGGYNIFHTPFPDGATYDGFFMDSRLSLGGTMTTAGNYIFQQINTGTTLTDYYNSTATNTVSGTFSKSTVYRICNNGSWGGFTSLNHIPEHILWLSDKTSDRSGINTNINTFYSIY